MRRLMRRQDNVCLMTCLLDTKPEISTGHHLTPRQDGDLHRSGGGDGPALKNKGK